MSSTSLRIAFIAALLTIVAVGAVVALRPSSDDIPVFQVEEREFVRRVTAEGTLRAVKSTPINAPSRARRGLKIATLLDNGSEVKKGDVLVTFDPTEFETQLFDGETLYENSENKLDKQGVLATAVQLNLTRDVRTAEDEYQSASQFAEKDADVFSRFDVIEANIDQDLALEKRDTTERVKEVRQDQSTADRQLIEIDQRKAKIKIDQARDGLDGLTIQAPHDGIFVLRANPWSGDIPEVGQQVWRGFPVGELPDLSAMEAEIFVLEADAGGLAEGIEAEIVVESDPGVVHRVERAIAVPRQAIFEHKGNTVVYRQDRGGFVPVTIVAGSATPGSVIITSGLNAGDVIAMQEPSSPNGEDKE
jgi:multidrug efflux pump subunit AcrA (membrane-fusion protein)